MLRSSFQAGSQGFVGLGVKAKGHVSDVFSIISLSPKPDTPNPPNRSLCLVHSSVLAPRLLFRAGAKDELP